MPYRSILVGWIVWRILPVDVLSKIASYKIGDPKYLKIKYNHIEALKRIQNKYKISRLGPKITRHLKSRKIYIYI